MAALKKVGHFNDLNIDAMAPLPEKGTTVIFKFPDATIDPITKTMAYPAKVKIPPKSVVWDGDSWKEIAIVKGGINRDTGEPNDVVRIWASPQSSAGHLSFVVGNSSEDDAKIQFLLLHSANGANPYRDPSVEVMFNTVNMEADAMKDREARLNRGRAMGHAYNLPDMAAVERTALLLGIDTSRKEEIIRNDIEKQAETNPDFYMGAVNDANADIKAVLAQSLKLGVVIVDEQSSQLKWGGNKQPILSLASPDTVKDEFAAFVNNEGHGPQVLDRMQSQNATIIKMKNAPKPGSPAAQRAAGQPAATNSAPPPPPPPPAEEESDGPAADTTAPATNTGNTGPFRGAEGAQGSGTIEPAGDSRMAETVNPAAGPERDGNAKETDGAATKTAQEEELSRDNQDNLKKHPENKGAGGTSKGKKA